MRWVSYLLALLVFGVTPGVAFADECDVADPPVAQEVTQRDRRDHEPVQPSTERIAPPVRENDAGKVGDARGQPGRHEILPADWKAGSAVPPKSR